MISTCNTVNSDCVMCMGIVQYIITMSDILKFLLCVFYHYNHIQIIDGVLFCGYIYCNKVILFSVIRYGLLQWLVSYCKHFLENVKRDPVKLFSTHKEAMLSQGYELC